VLNNKIELFIYDFHDITYNDQALFHTINMSNKVPCYPKYF